jgi:conjugal transfer pilus assembly protein TraD
VLLGLVLVAALLSLPPIAALGLLAAALTARTIGAVRAAVGRRPRRIAEGPRRAWVTLGRERSGREVHLSEVTLASHALIVGATGAGKTTTLLTVLQDRIRDGAAVVAIDLKGSAELAAGLADSALASGRPLRIFSPDGRTSWNPLAAGNATELKDKLMSIERFSEPHYERAAERFLQIAIGVLLARGSGRELSLRELAAALEPSRLATMARDLPAQSRSRVHEYLANLGGDQRSAARGFASRLAVLTESHVGPLLEPAQGAVDLRGALAGGEVVLFSLNSSRYGRLAAQLGALAVQDVLSATGARLAARWTDVGMPLDGARAEPASRRWVKQAYVAIDEFSALQCDNVIGLMARGREARVGVLLATQELADLERVAPGLRDQVLGNTALKLIHRQDVPSSCELAARLAGTTPDWDPTFRRRPNLGGVSGWERASIRAVDRPLIAAEEVRTLAPGEALAIVKAPSVSARIVRVDAPGRLASPAAGEVPPPAGKGQPSAGEAPPSAGRVPPSTGRVPPSAGRVPPSAGKPDLAAQGPPPPQPGRSITGTGLQARRPGRSPAPLRSRWARGPRGRGSGGRSLGDGG